MGSLQSLTTGVGQSGLESRPVLTSNLALFGRQHEREKTARRS